MTTQDPKIEETAEGAMQITVPLPVTAAKLRRTAFMLESIATNIEEAEGPTVTPGETPEVSAAAVLDDVRAVMMGRGRDYNYTNEIVNLVTLPGGTMGIGVTRRAEEPPIVCVAFGATGTRADMRAKLALPPGEIVPPLSYIEITDFDREGAMHLLSAIKLAYPDLLPFHGIGTVEF